MTFRNATLNDIDEMQQLYVDTIKTICKNDYDESQVDAWSSSTENKQRWLDLVNNQFVLLAEIDNQIVGYGTLKEENYIDFFYVHKDFQKQGIAQKILTELENKAKNANTRSLTSDISITAKPFFEKNGFKVIIKQSHIRKNVELVNYKMIKDI